MEALCPLCSKIFEGSFLQVIYKHHPSIFALLRAAEEGCVLCALLARSLSADAKCAMGLGVVGGLESGDSLPGIKFVLSAPTQITFTFKTIAKGEFELRMLMKEVTESADFSGFEKAEVARNTGSPDVCAVSAAWISECAQSHEECNVQRSSTERLPTRLISVGSVDEENVKLCPGDSLPPQSQYMTLSHCWGNNKFLTLTTQNVSTLSKSIPLSNLPKTFQDAVIFTRGLGIKYLWIDSLCIIQDSPDDWRKESLLMESVYKDSYCNLAATGASDSRGGLFGDRDTAYCKPVYINLGPSTCVEPVSSYDSPDATKESLLKPGMYSIYEEGIWVREIERSPLLKRAWVLQERLLARRVLHFSPNQVFFECLQHQACELYPHGIEDPKREARKKLPAHRVILHALNMKIPFDKSILYPSPKALLGDHLDKWMSIIEMYTACNLSHESDRLIAIAGLARHFQPIFNCPYFAGLWKHKFLHQLIWFNRGASSQRVDTYQAPSWSWASRPGPVAFGHSNYGTQSQLAALVGVKGKTADDENLGPVLYGSIRLMAPLIPVEVLEPSQPRSFQRPLKVRQYTFDFMPDIIGEEITGELYLAIFFAEEGWIPFANGLIITPTRKESGQFRRLGAFFHEDKRTPEFEAFCGDLIRGKRGEDEKVLMREDLYEECHSGSGLYIFSII